MLLFLIVVPVVVAAGTAALLARREAAASASPGAKHQPRAAGFGIGGQPVPVERSGDGLRTLIEPDYFRPWWLRMLRVVVLAVLLTGAAAVAAAAVYVLGKWAGDALKSFVSSG